MRLFINALAANAGGGLTYVRNVLPELAARPGVQTTVALNPALRHEFGVLENVDFLEPDVSAGRRFWYEQSRLPVEVRRSNADVLVSTGNVALMRSPVPQILLSRNSIYLSPDFYRDLWARGEYRLWLNTRLRAEIVRRSVRWAEVTVAPSHAFAAELERWAGARVVAIHHGFNRRTFTSETNPLSPEIESKLRPAEGSVKLLFVSHYNYYRNFETLIRALPHLRDRFRPRSVKLLLTCSLAAGANPGEYRPEAAARLVKMLGVEDTVIQLGQVPYRQLHHLYARADVYVSPAYAETFAHPMIEAMASGLPIVASDIAVHREICGDAAVYFSRFSPEELAVAVHSVVNSPEVQDRMAKVRGDRADTFSWKGHVDQLLEIARGLADGKSRPGKSAQAGRIAAL